MPWSRSASSVGDRLDGRRSRSRTTSLSPTGLGVGGRGRVRLDDGQLGLRRRLGRGSRLAGQLDLAHRRAAASPGSCPPSRRPPTALSSRRGQGRQPGQDLLDRQAVVVLDRHPAGAGLDFFAAEVAAMASLFADVGPHQHRHPAPDLESGRGQRTPRGRNWMLMRGPTGRERLGTACSHVRWQEPPITSRSPWPRAWRTLVAAALGPEEQLPGRADGDDGDHGVLGAAPADGVAVPGHAVAAVAVVAEPGGAERLAQLVGVVAASSAGRASSRTGSGSGSSSS